MESYDQEALRRLQSTNIKKREVKKKHPFRNFLIFVVVVGAIGYFLNSPFFDIKKVSVEGNEYYTEQEVVVMADVKMGNNLFFGTGTANIKQRLMKDPYFADVTIKRKLPGELVIQVKERHQIAGIIYGDKYLIIDPEGVFLRTGQVDPKLTLISGLQITKLKLGEPIEVKQTNTLKESLNMLTAMEKGDLFFKQIVFQEDENKYISAYVLDALIVKGKPEIVLERIKTEDIQKVVNKVIQSGSIRGTITVGNDNFITFSPDI